VVVLAATASINGHVEAVFPQKLGHVGLQGSSAIIDDYRAISAGILKC